MLIDGIHTVTVKKENAPFQNDVQSGNAAIFWINPRIEYWWWSSD